MTDMQRYFKIWEECGFEAPVTADPNRLAQIFDLPLRELATLASITQADSETRTDRSDVQEALLPFSRIAAKIVWLGGEESSIAKWFHTLVMYAWGKKTPYQHGADGNVAFVELDLTRLLVGVYA